MQLGQTSTEFMGCIFDGEVNSWPLFQHASFVLGVNSRSEKDDLEFTGQSTCCQREASPFYGRYFRGWESDRNHENNLPRKDRPPNILESFAWFFVVCLGFHRLAVTSQHEENQAKGMLEGETVGWTASLIRWSTVNLSRQSGCRLTNHLMNSQCGLRPNQHTLLPSLPSVDHHLYTVTALLVGVVESLSYLPTPL
jgi:hypothetical protein